MKMEYTNENFEKILRKYLGDKVVDIQMGPLGGGLVWLLDHFVKEAWYNKFSLSEEEENLMRTAYENLHYEKGMFGWNG